jgi:hypothetical protein
LLSSCLLALVALRPPFVVGLPGFEPGTSCPPGHCELRDKTVWGTPDEPCDLNQAAKQLATAVLERGADQMPHNRYLVASSAPSTLQGTIDVIAREIPNVVDYFAVPDPG